MTEPTVNDGSDLIQLGVLEVPVRALRAPSVDLVQLLSQFPITSPLKDWEFDRLPKAGWRVVDTKGPLDAIIEVRTFAAPSDKAAAWWLLTLTNVGGDWSAGASDRPISEEIPRSVRSRGLVLRWPATRIHLTDADEELYVLLTNAADTAYVGHKTDSYYVRGHLNSSDGSPVADKRWAAYSLRPLPTITPGDSLELPVKFNTDLARVKSGIYTATATIMCFGLETTTTLHLDL